MSAGVSPKGQTAQANSNIYLVDAQHVRTHDTTSCSRPLHQERDLGEGDGPLCCEGSAGGRLLGRLDATVRHSKPQLLTRHCCSQTGLIEQTSMQKRCSFKTNSACCVLHLLLAKREANPCIQALSDNTMPRQRAYRDSKMHVRPFGRNVDVDTFRGRTTAITAR
jgi:hypothetical protein